MGQTYAQAMRPIFLLLGVPLLLTCAAQVYGVRSPVVVVDLVAAAVTAWAALRLSRGTQILTRPEWRVLAMAWTTQVVALVASVTTSLAWAMSAAWAAVMLSAVLMARAESRAVLAASLVTALLAVVTPLSTTFSEWLVSLVIFGSLVVPVLAGGLVVRNQRRSAVVQREAARERERLAMAEELHDVIAHEITGIVVLAQAVGPMVQGTPAAGAIERIEGSGQRALEQIRSMVATARAAEPGTEATRAPNAESLSDLREVVENFAATVPADVRLTIEGEHRAVSPPVALAASRILTEALTNVRRHALSASRVDVGVVALDESLCVEVVDDGYGGGIGVGNGTGIAGIKQRASLLGGVAVVGRRSDGRWRVAATIPLFTVDEPLSVEAVAAGGES